ncbi:hypothetical protein F2P81_025083 [Scophthalmus maximus]|uniref:Uncharacterized protein n=1 Tax=Scophthalmus maximus TaxID=52904 RepID=A0A6A4RU44_SCOMX|nr:hypothetical protein F2P81_025083 [Scophthalmus maximus]
MNAAMNAAMNGVMNTVMNTVMNAAMNAAMNAVAAARLRLVSTDQACGKQSERLIHRKNNAQDICKTINALLAMTYVFGFDMFRCRGSGRVRRGNICELNAAVKPLSFTIASVLSELSLFTAQLNKLLLRSVFQRSLFFICSESLSPGPDL